MSGGGSGGSSKKDKPVAKTDYAGAPSQVTFQPTLPGGMQAHANQLAMGYGGQPSDIMAQLSNMYQPVTLQQFQQPISTTAAMWDKKKHNPINTGNSVLDQLLMGKTVGKEKK
jgi:hypothetical protein